MVIDKKSEQLIKKMSLMFVRITESFLSNVTTTLYKGDKQYYMDIKRYTRGVKTLLKCIFIEKPRGIDFSLRQKNHNILTEGNHGYALSSEKAFERIVKKLDINEKDNFIDVGCGKGGVLLFAAKYNFGRIAGVEVEESLYNIAVKNFKKLKLNKRIEVYYDNAITFPNYDEFNIFYFFNPFDGDIYRKVLDNIFRSIEKIKNKKVILVCYGKSEYVYIDNFGLFDILDQYTDNNRNTDVCIWKLKSKV